MIQPVSAAKEIFHRHSEGIDEPVTDTSCTAASSVLDVGTARYFVVSDTERIVNAPLTLVITHSIDSPKSVRSPEFVASEEASFFK
jgi:hypothetical protein